MVSTQKTFFATNPAFPSILAKAPFPIPDCVPPAARDRSSVNRSAKPNLQPPSVVKVIAKHPEIHSRNLLGALQYAGNTPTSVSDLLALGANRNADVVTDHIVDETAAFENDLAYYKVLLEAREKHREALRNKLRALRTIRANKTTTYRKRPAASPNPNPNPNPTTMSRKDTSADTGDVQHKLNNLRHTDPWPTQCASPVSTDIESDISSVPDDDTVSLEKHAIHAV